MQLNGSTGVQTEGLLVLKHNELHTHTHNVLLEAINLPGDTLLEDETGVFTCT